jgi:hypothetical protein
VSEEKVGMGGSGPVSVRRGVNPIRAFLDMLSKRRFGVFMIWLHEGRVVKWSEMSQPTVVRADGSGEEKSGQER